MILKENESIKYAGGATVIGSGMISAFTNLMKTLYSFGQNLGSSIRRLVTKTTC